MIYFAHIQGRGQGCDYTLACNQRFERIHGVKTLEEARTKVLEKYHDQIVRDCDGHTVAEIDIYECEEANPFSLDLAAYKAEALAKEREEERVSSEAAERQAYERLKKKFG